MLSNLFFVIVKEKIDFLLLSAFFVAVNNNVSVCLTKQHVTSICAALCSVNIKGQVRR